jgi:Carboxypeptidase regulatory-like domain
VVKVSWGTASRVFAAITLVVACLLPTFAFAQSGTTSLRGTVLDKTGAAVTGANVVLTNTSQALERQTKSNNSGAYEFVALPPGTYVLTVEASGFRKYEQKNLQLLVDSPGTADVTLDIGSTSDTVEVSAQAVNLNTTDASLGNAFNENQIKQLPIESRNVPDLLSLQAGVTYTGNRSDINKDLDSRSGAVNGAHSDQSNITLDGVDVNDETRGYAFTSVLPVSLDSVQEFRVTTSNYNADSGRSSGAQVSLVTKSGTNDFHGSAYEYHRNTFTSANDYFVKQSELQSSNPNEAPKLIRNIFGASLGGPVWKNRLFFFANFEAYRQAEQNSVVRIVPSAAMRDGVMQYQCDDPTACPGGTVVGLSGTSYTVAAGNHALSPTQLQALDPQNLGANPVVVNYLKSFPLPNDNTQGDGLNEVGYRFRGPISTNNNWYIARLDYKITSNGNHTLFARGALRNDTQGGVPYFPGQIPEQTLADYSKGVTVGYTGVLSSSIVNNFRWGFTRQSFGQIGNSDKQQILFRALNDNGTTNNSTEAVVRTRTFQVPVHNLTDDISWLKGKHTWQFGTNVAFLRNPRSSSQSSFSDGSTNPGWLPAAAIAGTGSYMDPGANGLPAVASGFGSGYDFPLVTLLGAITQVDAQYNYKLDGSVLPQGAPLTRRFATDSYEFYAQDSFKVKPNLTVTYGLRYSLFPAPWETNGYQSTPTINLGNWFNLRAQNMSKGIGSFADPLVSFALSGPANGKAGFYGTDFHNFGPRVGIAWSPGYGDGLLKSVFGGPGKSSIRAGFGIVYDRIGQGLLSTFDRRGAFGLSSTLTNPNGQTTLATAPRLTSLDTIPTTDVSGDLMFAPAPPGTFPQTFPTTGQGGAYSGSTFGVDSSIKTPYSYTIDFSVSRDLGHNFSIQASYVGRLSHRLLSQEDLAQPTDLVDPKTHIDYYTAVQALAKVYRSANAPAPGAVTAAMVGPTASYWTDMTQALKAGGAYSLDHNTVQVCPQTVTTDPLQINYALFSCYNGNETTAIQRIDQSGFPDPNNAGVIYNGNCGQTGSVPNCYVNSQYAALFAWRSVGTAAYNALQVNLQKHFSKGLQFDLNYTFSKSMDLESDAERVDLLGVGALGQIFNAWRPKQLRAVSDFDSPHQINANWVAELPFGRGRWIGKESHGLTEAVIGGWQLTGVARWTSGFPVSVANGFRFPTDWDFAGLATQVAPAVVKTTKNPDGTVNLFPDPLGPTGIQAFQPTFPGQSGTRNSLRGDGFAGLDLGLAKRWKMPWLESHTLQFRWDVYNALNLTRFDVQSVTTSIDAGSFGNYSGLLTNPRVMQFALRYEF